MASDSKGDKKGGAGGGDDEEQDPRLDFMFEYLQRSLRLKPDKWAKLLANKELNKFIFDFFKDPNIKMLVMVGSASGIPTPQHSFPVSTGKGKSSYFIKKSPEAITKENFRSLLIFGDIAAKPVDELAVLVQEVFVPLLSNPKNQRSWPKVVADDIMRHVYELKNIVYEVRGKINGQTLLPMPVGIERVHEVEQTIIESEGQTVDLYLKSAIEEVVIKWATQIDDVLKEDSSCAFTREANPTPRFVSPLLLSGPLRCTLLCVVSLRDGLQCYATLLPHCPLFGGRCPSVPKGLPEIVDPTYPLTPHTPLPAPGVPDCRLVSMIQRSVIPANYSTFPQLLSLHEWTAWRMIVKDSTGRRGFCEKRV
ncbi:dynein beta chain, ciliary-like [Periplaneta americana]|uniref:dynein beta chain, ciliary-like n=1 Tax=Periplaneta americana TaxID=6978 RepID=UPI0037E7A39D